MNAQASAPAPRAADPVDVVIVGAGFTGLSAALELATQGRSVRIIEREEIVGGLAASFDIGDGKRLERFYHHWFSSDTEMIRLCESLGISHLLEAHETRTGVYYANSVYRLSAPLDVLRFAPLALRDRIRLGLLALRAQKVRHWRELESRTAEEWLVSLGGRRVYEVVWRPLLEGKFGKYASQVGATWMWTKLHLRGGSRTRSGKETLYYIKGGSEALLGALRRRLESLGVDIRTGVDVEAVHTEGAGVSGVRAGASSIRPGTCSSPRRRRSRRGSSTTRARTTRRCRSCCGAGPRSTTWATSAWSWRTGTGSPTRTGSTSTTPTSRTSASSSTPTSTGPSVTTAGTSSTSPSTCRPTPSCTG
ncbi:FAD-dependent oxidoreductase [Streptomyces diastatochromogenes]|nr:FAD-dependent oxidoreductase [Streptomyces diastatochromogenes]